ncbi:MAG: hypothetical protein RLZZ342_196 [Candidatus Parcubacteria bacterium]|jgi:hypothetical protein
MTAKYDKYLGYLKYDGERVAEGFLDAKQSAEILLAFDESIRFFARREGVHQEFELPVKINEGSWEIQIPITLYQWSISAVGAGATVYAVTAAKKLAENDFKDVTTGDIVKSALSKIKQFIQIRKHIGTNEKAEIKKSSKIINGTIHIVNSQGGMLALSKEDFDAYMDAPDNILNNLAKPIDDKMILRIATIDKGIPREETIGPNEKLLFFKSDINEEMLLPELCDGATVSLEGEITKGNERTNFIGLEYKGFILNCRPVEGGVRPHKPFLFTRSIVHGVVHRPPGEKSHKFSYHELNQLKCRRTP